MDNPGSQKARKVPVRIGELVRGQGIRKGESGYHMSRRDCRISIALKRVCTGIVDLIRSPEWRDRRESEERKGSSLVESF